MEKVQEIPSTVHVACSTFVVPSRTSEIHDQCERQTLVAGDNIAMSLRPEPKRTALCRKWDN